MIKSELVPFAFLVAFCVLIKETTIASSIYHSILMNIYQVYDPDFHLHGYNVLYLLSSISLRTQISQNCTVFIYSIFMSSLPDNICHFPSKKTPGQRSSDQQKPETGGRGKGGKKKRIMGISLKIEMK
ncbi:uncharacterized protein BO80DRAFT_20147 [Aspergillus ibericus CBS 121593]|uniref:Uncharacterized protein n=1 Tax=Aspergillus ibericus CBS 121593 TaxID=1448316 RepID=A0A395H5V1_9EURO|nr:hypothetical protein BO80DRAFT_20147 [Aspergillus ibericus CBS 121593]RAL02899.1 hypothetical protein BO80DRAFT_20147 [Aspergillus ibericus CBS 121593]